MPDWKKVIKDIAQSIEVSVGEANARQQVRKRGTAPYRRPSAKKTCLFWDCGVAIRSDHVMCYDHYAELQDGLVDECPGCNRAKYAEYEVCLDCYRKPHRPPQSRASRPSHQWYKPEYSAAWAKGDAKASEFFVYILKLDGGQFYAGQTRELRERMSEHRDGKTQSTGGRNPKLVWFTTFPTREAATSMEVEMKKLVDANPREIRRMVIKFRDFVKELDYS